MSERNLLTWESVLGEAIQAHASGNFEQAEQAYRQVLALSQGQPDASHNLACLVLSQNPHLTSESPSLLAEALELLLGALKAQPENPQYWLSYTEALLLAGRPDEARQCLELGREAGLAGTPVDQLEIRVTAAWLKQPDLARVRKLLERGEYQEAKQLVAQQVQQFGEQPILLLLAGEVAIRMQEFQEAIGNLKQASVHLQTDPAVWHMLGLAHQSLGDFEAAYCSYLKGLRYCPNNKQILADIGRCLFHAGRLMEAMVWLRLPLLMGTDDWSIWDDFIQLLCKAGIANEALGAYQKHRQALRPPQGLQTRSVLTMLEMGLLETAFQTKHKQQLYFTPIPESVKKNVDRYLRERKYEQLGVMAQGLCEQHPFDAFGWKVLGAMVRALGGDMEQALLALQLSAAAAPEDIESQLNLAVLMNEVKRPKAAELACRRAIAINPGSARSYLFLGVSLQQQGKSVAAVEAYEKCLELNPKMHAARSAIQFSQHYSCSDSSGLILVRARDFARLIAPPKREVYKNWLVKPRCSRIRVGFVSGDLRTHPVGYLTEGLFKNLAGWDIDLYAYSTASFEDELTARIKPFFKCWQMVENYTDADLAMLIRNNGINILIDLSGHTAYNRLAVFARKPAPIQVSWLGYFATTGIKQIDYFVGDVYSMLPGEEENFVEKLWRLPRTFCCVEKLECGSECGELVRLDGLPADRNGYITFGSFNKLSKMSDNVFDAWVQILAKNPTARLLLNAPELIDQVNRQALEERFEHAGIMRQQLRLIGWNRSRVEHLQLYNDVDIGLDTFPYVGGTTTLDALLMGVPVLTCKGNRFLSNIGHSMLTNAGLSDWVCESKDDYVEMACCYANNLSAINAARTQLRSGLARSPLCNVEDFALDFKEMLWSMWREFVFKS